MRNISFFLTQAQFKDKSKTVTRRLGWKNLTVGTELMGVVKGQGLKPGEKIQKLGKIKVTSVRREQLLKITKDDCVAEGFPEMDTIDFGVMFCKHMKCTPFTTITRIEFEYLE